MSEFDIAPGAVCEGAKVEDIIARTVCESSLSKKGDPKTDRMTKGLTRNSRAGNPKRTSTAKQGTAA